MSEDILETISIKCTVIVEEESIFEGTLRLEKSDNLLELCNNDYILPGDVIHMNKLVFDKYLLKDFRISSEFKVENVEITDDYVELSLSYIIIGNKGIFRNGDRVNITVNATNYYDKDSKIIINKTLDYCIEKCKVILIENNYDEERDSYIWKT